MVSGEGMQTRALALRGVRTLLPGSPAPPLQAESPLPPMAAAATQITLAANAAGACMPGSMHTSLHCNALQALTMTKRS